VSERVLFISHYLPPAYKAGGPISVVRALLATGTVVDRMDFLGSSRELGSVRINATTLKAFDRDFPNVFRRDSALRILWYLMARRSRYGVVYINSLFDFRYSILPVLVSLITGTRICISPRGELHPPALKSKRQKKRLWIATVRLIERFKTLHWIATNIEEAEHIRRNLLAKTAQVQILNDPIPTIPAIKRKTRAKDDPPVVLTCGRIAPIKNHKFVFECLEQLEKPLVWKVIGTIEDQRIYDELVRSTAVSRWIDLQYEGARPHDEVLAAMREADVLFNPSFSENFGYVFLEALACGLPILTSNGTPWKHLSEHGVGANIDLADKEGFRAALSSLLEPDLENSRGKLCRKHYLAIKQEYSPVQLIGLLDRLVKEIKLGR